LSSNTAHDNEGVQVSIGHIHCTKKIVFDNFNIASLIQITLVCIYFKFL
jgi:hypothetical protein